MLTRSVARPTAPACEERITCPSQRKARSRARGPGCVLQPRRDQTCCRERVHVAAAEDSPLEVQYVLKRAAKPCESDVAASLSACQLNGEGGSQRVCVLSPQFSRPRSAELAEEVSRLAGHGGVDQRTSKVRDAPQGCRMAPALDPAALRDKRSELGNTRRIAENPQEQRSELGHVQAVSWCKLRRA